MLSITNRPRQERVFALLIDNVPTLTFLSMGHPEALQLPREGWLKEDLSELRSDGKPLWSVRAKITIRSATNDEEKAYRAITADRESLPGELLLAYLIPIDRAAS